MKYITNNNTKHVLITHSTSCLDGRTCAVIYNMKMKELGITNFEIEYTQYGDTTCDVEKYRGVNLTIADFSFDYDTLVALHGVANTIKLIDHHQLSDEITSLDFVEVDHTACGAMLLWEELFPDNKVPVLISEVVDARDRWTEDWVANKGNCQAASIGYSLIPYENYDEMESHLHDTSYITNRGEAILNYNQIKVDKTDSNRDKLMTIDIAGHTGIPLINTGDLISEKGNALSIHYPFVVMWFVTETTIVFSLRSHKDNPEFVDVSEVCKLYGGGGHIHAAGCNFKIGEYDITKLLTTKDFDKGIM